MSIRIDKWLWFARIHKTRSLAAQAINAGRVKLNGARVKPSQTATVGDLLVFTKGQLEYRLTIAAIPKRRGPVKEAQALYEEDEASRLERERRTRMLAEDRALTPMTDGKPDKHTRRRLRDWHRGS